MYRQSTSYRDSRSQAFYCLLQPTEILVLLSPAENTDRPKWAPSDFSGPTRGEASQNSSLFASSGSISATCYCCCTAGAGYYGMVGNGRPTGEQRASRRAAQHCATNFCLQKFRPRDGHLAQLDARASHSGAASIRNSPPALSHYLVGCRSAWERRRSRGGGRPVLRAAAQKACCARRTVRTRSCVKPHPYTMAHWRCL